MGDDFYTAAVEELDNLSGAIIFAAYIFAALTLTTFLLSNLYNASLHPQSPFKRKTNDTASKDAQRHIQIFAFLAIISFSILSYHMLNYLFLSYTEWATARNIELPYRIWGDKGIFASSNDRTIQIHLWRWLKTSSLFLDFAHRICESSERFWWTLQALLVTMGWSVFMSVEGPRRQIPHLWAYTLLSQILPISFTTNLFFIAILLQTPLPPTTSDQKTNPPDPLIQLIAPALYALSTLALPHLLDTDFFLPLTLTIRLLLFLPLLTPYVLPQSMMGKQEEVSVRDTHASYSRTYTAIGVGSLYLVCFQFMMALADTGFDFIDIVKAVNGDSAVSALGYDYLVCLVSAWVWWRVVGGRWD